MPSFLATAPGTDGCASIGDKALAMASKEVGVFDDIGGKALKGFSLFLASSSSEPPLMVAVPKGDEDLFDIIGKGVETIVFPIKSNGVKALFDTERKVTAEVGVASLTFALNRVGALVDMGGKLALVTDLWSFQS